MPRDIEGKGSTIRPVKWAEPRDEVWFWAFAKAVGGVGADATVPIAPEGVADFVATLQSKLDELEAGRLELLRQLEDAHGDTQELANALTAEAVARGLSAWRLENPGVDTYPGTSALTAWMVRDQLKRAQPEAGECHWCIVCALDKPWGVWCSTTGASVCDDCARAARHEGDRVNLIQSKLDEAVGALEKHGTHLAGCDSYAITDEDGCCWPAGECDCGLVATLARLKGEG